MSDVFCRVCGEPWDAYGLRPGPDADMTPDEISQFYHGKGCPACGFGTRCTQCHGTGMERALSYGTRCSHCLGQRYLVIRKCVAHIPGLPDDWWFGYRPHVEELPGEPIGLRDKKMKEAKDGWYVEAICTCPWCAKDPAVPKCATCGGDGKLHVTKKEDDRRTLAFWESAFESTDLCILAPSDLAPQTKPLRRKK